MLLIDVDGVISLFGFDPAHPPAGRLELVDGIGHLLSSTAGEHLRALSQEFELVWCTGWEEKAGEYLPAALGLPASVPHLKFDGSARPGAHWKLSAIEAYVGTVRPVAWIDDAHDKRCTAWAAGRVGPTLLLATDPAVGLTEGHVAELLAWARGVLDRGPPPGPRGLSRPPRPSRREAAARPP